MTAHIKKIHVRNYRALADVQLELGSVGVFFGPNGSGKSTLLDTLWFVRDCAIRGVEAASASRSHGIGILFDGAPEADQRVAIELDTSTVDYKLEFDLSSGRINPLPGEQLVGRVEPAIRIDRRIGADQVRLFNSSVEQYGSYELREPDKLTLSLYLGFNPTDEEAGSFDKLLHFVRLYHSRSFFLHRLKVQGSQSSPDTRLWDRGDNAWSVLRNLHDRKNRDVRFSVIMQFMREAFPSFEEVALEQTGPGSVYANFYERDRSSPILASGVSDGHLQLLLVLTALFCEGPERAGVIMLDEPEISLHPWALAVLARAIRLASSEWNKQVLLATHSPVLMSQFQADELIATEVTGGRTSLRRLSSMSGIQDLLDQYAAGSLYMSETIGSQALSEAHG